MSADEARLLPLPRVAHGAVGRPRVDRVHRRHGDRRGARPQRPAPEPLLGHRRRPRDHGERGRRRRRRPGARREEGSAAAGPDVPRRHRQGPHRRRRGDQGRAGRRAAVRASGSSRASCTSTTCPTASTSCPATSRCCGARRRSATPTRSSSCSWRRWRAPAARRSARWAPTRRSRCCPTGSRMLFDYFQQLFAQVTNPPLDAIREELVTSLSATIGAEGNLLEPQPAVVRADRAAVPDHRQRRAGQAHPHRRRRRPSRVRGARDLRPLPVAGGGAALREALDRVRAEASAAIAEGKRILVLSDRDSDAESAPIPSLLLTSAVHHHLIREKTRTQVGLVVEAGDAREVHHMALLIGYGAGRDQPVPRVRVDRGPHRAASCTASAAIDPQGAIKNYIKAAGKGVLKVMSKMGISTVASYRGAQVFEAIGLEPGAGRRVLHRHRVAPRRHRPRRDRARRSTAPRASRTPSGPTSARTATSSSAASTSGGARASTTSSTRRRCSSCSTRRAPSATTSTRSTRSLVDDQSTQLATLRGLFELREGVRAAGADRRGRAGRRDRQALRDRRDVVRLHLEGSARERSPSR